MDVFNSFKDRYEARYKQEEYSLQEYLALCKQDRMAYANAAERLLAAIGEPNFVDTSKDRRLSRIFSNKVMKLYDSFESFYGMEEPIEQIVSFLKHAAQGLLQAWRQTVSLKPKLARAVATTLAPLSHGAATRRVSAGNRAH